MDAVTIDDSTFLGIYSNGFLFLDLPSDANISSDTYIMEKLRYYISSEGIDSRVVEFDLYDGLDHYIGDDIGLSTSSPAPPVVVASRNLRDIVEAVKPLIKRRSSADKAKLERLDVNSYLNWKNCPSFPRRH